MSSLEKYMNISMSYPVDKYPVDPVDQYDMWLAAGGHVCWFSWVIFKECVGMCTNAYYNTTEEF